MNLFGLNRVYNYYKRQLEEELTRIIENLTIKEDEEVAEVTRLHKFNMNKASKNQKKKLRAEHRIEIENIRAEYKQKIQLLVDEKEHKLKSKKTDIENLHICLMRELYQTFWYKLTQIVYYKQDRKSWFNSETWVEYFRECKIYNSFGVETKGKETHEDIFFDFDKMSFNYSYKFQRVKIINLKYSDTTSIEYNWNRNQNPETNQKENQKENPETNQKENPETNQKENRKENQKDNDKKIKYIQKRVDYFKNNQYDIIIKIADLCKYIHKYYTVLYNTDYLYYLPKARLFYMCNKRTKLISRDIAKIIYKKVLN
jgi:chemotaxis protein histidine kinase CheA